MFAKQKCLCTLFANIFVGTLLFRVPASIIIIPLFLQKVKKSMMISQIFFCLSLPVCQTVFILSYRIINY